MVEFSPALPNHGAFSFKGTSTARAETSKAFWLNRSSLVPDDLLVVFEADPEKAIQNFARESRGRKLMPARLNFAPVGGFHDAFARISFEIWHRQRILIVSESGLCGAQP
jgi:hypothetical protein